MPDLILSSAMDSFLAEEDPTQVFLPLAGGTMDAGADINFANGSMLREGTTDAGNGGAGGIAQVCSISYELKWEAGRLYAMEQDGFTIRVEQYGFTDIPDTSDDGTKGYIVGSRRILDDGTIYICADATTGSAIWNIDQASLAFLNRQLVDSGNIISANWGYRQLYGSDGIPCAGWNSSGFNFGWDGSFDFYHTLNADGINTPAGLVVDIGYKQLKSSVGTSLDWENRQLIGNDGSTVMLNWSYSTPNFPQGIDSVGSGYIMSGQGFVGYNGNQSAAEFPLGLNLPDSATLGWGSVGTQAYITASGSSGSSYIEMGNVDQISMNAVVSIPYPHGLNAYRIATSSGGIGADAILVDGRQLVGSDGSTVALDWSAGTGIQVNAIIRDASNNDTIYPTNRLLLGTDGSTIAVDWSSGIPVTPRATLTPNTVAALTGGEGTIAYVNDADTPVTHGQPIVGGGVEKALVCFNGTDWITVSHLS